MKKFQSENLDSKISGLKTRMSNTIILAFEKVVAHHENPSAYPLPADGKSLERALHNLFEKMPLIKRKKLIDKIDLTLKAGSAKRVQIYGDLAGIDLKSPEPIAEQVKALPLPASLKLAEDEITEIQIYADGLKTGYMKKNGKASSIAAANLRQGTNNATKVGFFLDELTCSKTDDIRKDEINLAAFGVDSLGNSINLPPSFVGKFKKGESHSFGNQNRLFDFDLVDAVFPKTFAAGFFIVEKDLIRNSDFMDALLLAIEVIAASLALVGLAMCIAGSLGAPVSFTLFIICGSVALLLGIIGGYILPFMIDDISFPASDVLTLEQPVDIGVVFDRSIQIGEGFFGLSTDQFQGKYVAGVRWLGE